MKKKTFYGIVAMLICLAAAYALVLLAISSAEPLCLLLAVVAAFGAVAAFGWLVEGTSFSRFFVKFFTH